MLSAKYADKSFDDLVNRKCAEHSQMKLHKRLGVSRFPVAKETIYPQVERPSASGITGMQSVAPAVLHIKERPNYSGGMPIGNLNDLQGKTISQVGINHTIPLYKPAKATFIIPKKNVESSTEDLMFPVSRGTNTAIGMPEENRLALLKKNTGTNPESELEDLEYFSEAELKRLRAKSRQTQTEENPAVENEANMYYQEALKDFKEITEDMSANGTNPENSRRLNDAIKRNERAYRERVAYESGLHFGRAEADDDLAKLVKQMKDLSRIGEREKEMRYEALLKGLPITTTIKELYFTIKDGLDKAGHKTGMKGQSAFNKLSRDEKIDYLLEQLTLLYDEPTYELLYLISQDPNYIESGNESESGSGSEPLVLGEPDDENVIDEVVNDLIEDQVRIDEMGH